jgi:hypothetical protein
MTTNTLKEITYHNIKCQLIYTNTHFYKLVCNDTTITDCFVGYSINLTDSINKHRQCSTNNERRVYKFIKENGGFDNFHVVLIATLNLFDFQLIVLCPVKFDIYIIVFIKCWLVCYLNRIIPQSSSIAVFLFWFVFLLLCLFVLWLNVNNSCILTTQLITLVSCFIIAAMTIIQCIMC